MFTIDGRMVSNSEFKGDSFTNDLNLQPGIYVVKVMIINMNRNYL
ncbi:T9SS type A sorting domain-containing protein [Carboxylicivirga sp. N1Y132]|uniref:T9SS type A sorting domain-containing protein n=1 Tax=Carboxylicivirga marina TaxID=2800988 RepID=A0ABS1HFT8_9BACT|nr:T9SS type A sorting domain-containing protein [Carboxylicivirga marina]